MYKKIDYANRPDLIAAARRLDARLAPVIAACCKEMGITEAQLDAEIAAEDAANEQASPKPQTRAVLR